MTVVTIKDRSTKSYSASEKELRRIKQEVLLLRSFMISVIGKDSEGQYRPEFVKEIIRASQEKPNYRFHDVRSFLAELKRV